MKCMQNVYGPQSELKLILPRYQLSLVQVCVFAALCIKQGEFRAHAGETLVFSNIANLVCIFLPWEACHYKILHCYAIFDDTRGVPMACTHIQDWEGPWLSDRASSGM